MKYQVKEVALSITNECSHKCPMCYATCIEQKKREGSLETLKKIADELRKDQVKTINLVGGDPAEYSKVEELIIYLNSLGFNIPILSNTHNYKNSSVEKITSYVSSLEVTIHGSSAKEHNQFCGKERAFEKVIENLKIYDSLRNENQNLGIVMNLMKHNCNGLVSSLENVLAQGLSVDYVLIQRIAPFYLGKKFDNTITQENVVQGFEQIKYINEEMGIETIMVDSFPLCILPEEYHQYVSKCDWGYGTAAMDMDGNLSRCAMSSHYSLGNILETPIDEIWNHAPMLERFRSKEYLDEECQNCELLEKCGGGCAMSCGNENLTSDYFVKQKRQ